MLNKFKQLILTLLLVIGISTVGNSQDLDRKIRTIYSVDSITYLVKDSFIYSNGDFRVMGRFMDSLSVASLIARDTLQASEILKETLKRDSLLQIEKDKNKAILDSLMLNKLPVFKDKLPK